MKIQELYKKYQNILQKAADIEYATALMAWDKEVYMPTKGAQIRARQEATLTGMAHELLTSNELADILSELNTNRFLEI